jgi:phenylacetate-CoA ligase
MRHWLVWNIFFRLQEALKGHPTFRILRELEAAERLFPDELARLRAARLQQLMEYGSAHVPYIQRILREAGLKASDIQGPADLRHLPLIRKADARKLRAELRSRVAGRLSEWSTGGSTGEPLLYDVPQERIASWVACHQRVMRWFGLSAGAREVALWGSPVEATRQDVLRRLRDKAMRTKLLSAFDMSDATMSRYLDYLESSGCRAIYSYPSSIYLLCLHAQKERRNLRRLGIRVVFVTGEVLYQHQREVITETLNCPVANGYGGRDSGYLAHECPQGGMHIMADATIVEILDPQGRLVPEGEPGEIVITDLYSKEVPFVRYATGDIGRASSRRCRCGRCLPLLECIEGRSNDSIVAPDGTILHAQSISYVLRSVGVVQGIEHYRVVQKAPDRLHVQIVRNEQYPADGESRLRAGWSQLLRAPLDITFEYLRSLPPEPSGKCRYIISHVAIGQQARPAAMERANESQPDACARVGRP